MEGANVARDFLRSRGIDEQDIETVWTAIALHTTPGIPQHMHPVIALVTAGVEMVVLGIAFPSSQTWNAKPSSASIRGLIVLRKRSSTPL